MLCVIEETEIKSVFSSWLALNTKLSHLSELAIIRVSTRYNWLRLHKIQEDAEMVLVDLYWRWFDKSDSTDNLIEKYLN